MASPISPVASWVFSRSINCNAVDYFFCIGKKENNMMMMMMTLSLTQLIKTDLCKSDFGAIVINNLINHSPQRLVLSHLLTSAFK